MSQPDDETPPPSASPPPGRALPDDERVPLFGTWRAIHAAVVACALTVMALVFLFSRWPF